MQPTNGGRAVPRRQRSHYMTPLMPEVATPTVTTVLVSNLHCNSCVRTIQDALLSLTPAPDAVNVSIVSQSVSVHHPDTLSHHSIQLALVDAGFDVAEEDAAEHPPKAADGQSGLSGLLGRKRRHIEQCELCQAELADGGKTQGSSQDVHVRHQPSQLSTVPLSPTDVIADMPREPSAPDLWRVSLSVGGMTCSSCVNTITELLSAIPGVCEVFVNLILGSATCVIDKRSLADEVVGAVNDAGYEGMIVDVQRLQSRESSKLSKVEDQGPLNVVLSIGGMTCSSCVNTVRDALSSVSGVHSVAVNLVSNSASCIVDDKTLLPTIKEAVEDGGYDAEIVTVESKERLSARGKFDNNQGPFTLCMSVGGMTCSSCVNTITNMIESLDGVHDVSVNLVLKSTTCTIDTREIAEKVREAIYDAGYEVSVISIESTHSTEDSEQESRTVDIRIDGMFCEHCPSRVVAAVKVLDGSVSVDRNPTLANPTLTISYMPSPPSFTLRTIVTAIGHASDKWIVSLANAPSIEERAAAMRKREQRSLLNRLSFAFVVAIPTFIIGIVYMSLVSSDSPGKRYLMEPMWTGNTARAVWAMFFLATPVYVYSAGPFHRRSMKEIYSIWKPGSRVPILRRFVRFGSMNLLVSSGVTVAYFSSVALIALAASQAPFSGGTGDTTTYFDSVVFLTFFLLCGRFLEAYSKARTADAVKALSQLRPSATLVLSPTPSDLALPKNSDIDLEKGSDSTESSAAAKPGFFFQKCSVDLLEVGDIVRVQTGATPPADGTVMSGQGSFDESSLTGESRLIKKTAGDQVFLGTVSMGALVDVRIDAIGGGTMLDHIVNVVREGQAKRAPIESLADILTGYFVPCITLLAIVTWIIWLSLGLSGVLPHDYLDIQIGGWVVWSLEFAIAVFVVACPCGIGLAAPTALLVGSGLAAKYGILARGGGAAFQEMAQVDLIVFDKTGTLTEGGDPKVTDAYLTCPEGMSRRTVMGLAHEIESATSHPLALAIRSYCEVEGMDAAASELVEETAGRGLKATFPAHNCDVIIGNEMWMQEHGVLLATSILDRLHAWKQQAKSVVLLAIKKPDAQSYTIAATYAISDTIRPEARPVIAHLHGQGIGTWMISGDNEITAKTVAQSIGIPSTNVIAGVLPHEKAEKIRWLQLAGMKRQSSTWPSAASFGRHLNNRCIVAMVGDGINDAPAITSADVGIAIGSGSDVALSSASFILVSSNLGSLLTLSSLSRKVFNRVKFNFLWALIYNIAAVPIAAGVVYPAGHARLNPVWASLAMALSSVSVVCSSLLLKLYKEPKLTL